MKNSDKVSDAVTGSGKFTIWLIAAVIIIPLVGAFFYALTNGRSQSMPVDSSNNGYARDIGRDDQSQSGPQEEVSTPQPDTSSSQPIEASTVLDQLTGSRFQWSPNGNRTLTFIFKSSSTARVIENSYMNIDEDCRIFTIKGDGNFVVEVGKELNRDGKHLRSSWVCNYSDGVLTFTGGANYYNNFADSIPIKIVKGTDSIVMDRVENQLSIIYPNPYHYIDEERYIIIGESDGATILIVVHLRSRFNQRACLSPDGATILIIVHTERNEKIRIISAREATKQEKRFYEQRF